MGVNMVLTWLLTWCKHGSVNMGVNMVLIWCKHSVNMV